MSFLIMIIVYVCTYFYIIWNETPKCFTNIPNQPKHFSLELNQNGVCNEIDYYDWCHNQDFSFNGYISDTRCSVMVDGLNHATSMGSQVTKLWNPLNPSILIICQSIRAIPREGCDKWQAFLITTAPDIMKTAKKGPEF